MSHMQNKQEWVEVEVEEEGTQVDQTRQETADIAEGVVPVP